MTTTTRKIVINETRINAADLDVLVVEREGVMPVVAVAQAGFTLDNTGKVLSVRCDQIDELIQALTVARNQTH